LEAARGLVSQGVEVMVVESAPHLMPQQLDPTGAGVLRQKMEALGVGVLTGTTVTQIEGEGQVSGVRLSDGRTFPAEMVVIACGIRANVDEARAAGLVVERGVVVDDQMR